MCKTYGCWSCGGKEKDNRQAYHVAQTKTDQCTIITEIHILGYIQCEQSFATIFN